MKLFQSLKNKIKRSFGTLKTGVVEEVPAEVVGCMLCNETGCTHEDIEKCPNRQYHEKMYGSLLNNPSSPPDDDLNTK